MSVKIRQSYVYMVGVFTTTKKKQSNDGSIVFIHSQQVSKTEICLENCERCYSTSDCLRICNTLNIPLIYVYIIIIVTLYSIQMKNNKEPNELMPLVLSTWHKRNLKPYFHISEQGSGRVGHHSDFINLYLTIYSI